MFWVAEVTSVIVLAARLEQAQVCHLGDTRGRRPMVCLQRRQPPSPVWVSAEARRPRPHYHIKVDLDLRGLART